MKKFVYWFLIASTILAIQVQCLEEPIVNAKPMMDTSTSSEEKNVQFPIPMLSNLQQISPNQIQISYDKAVDQTLGTRSTNYWVQDVINATPQGIATLGKNDTVSSRNSLTDSLVKIESKDGSNTTFILTFNKDIPKGLEYKLIICYVTVEGAPLYSGDNGSATFIGK